MCSNNAWKWVLLLVSVFLMQPLYIIFSASALAADISAQKPIAQANTGSRPVRALHLSLEPAAKADEQVTPEMAKRLIRLAQSNGFNTLIILLANNVMLKSMPGSVHDRSWTSSEFVEVVEFARRHGLDVIPEVKLLSKQRMFFANNYPHMMYNRFTYDPRNDEVYATVFAVLDEVIGMIQPRAIHIGHDEVERFSPESRDSLGELERVLPSDLFLKDVMKIHSYLRQRGVETWMWGDMLISPQEFPSMFNEDKSLNGDLPGYGKVLRTQLPKDIVICDWHYVWGQPNYTQFPTITAFITDGFHVLGATWSGNTGIINFSRFASAHGAGGMIATLWYYPRQNKWNVVERIIQESGAAFSKDFPDAK